MKHMNTIQRIRKVVKSKLINKDIEKIFQNVSNGCRVNYQDVPIYKKESSNQKDHIFVNKLRDIYPEISESAIRKINNTLQQTNHTQRNNTKNRNRNTGRYYYDDEESFNNAKRETLRIINEDLNNDEETNRANEIALQYMQRASDADNASKEERIKQEANAEANKKINENVAEYKHKLDEKSKKRDKDIDNFRRETVDKLNSESDTRKRLIDYSNKLKTEISGLSDRDILQKMKEDNFSTLFPDIDPKQFVQRLHRDIDRDTLEDISLKAAFKKYGSMLSDVNDEALREKLNRYIADEGRYKTQKRWKLEQKLHPTEIRSKKLLHHDINPLLLRGSTALSKR